METVMGKNAHRAEMEQERIAPESPASVFEPVNYGEGVRGGWKKARVSPAAAGLVAGVAIAGVALWRKNAEDLRMTNRAVDG